MVFSKTKGYRHEAIEAGKAAIVALGLQNKFEVELDRTNVTLNKKVRNAQLAQFNYILVVGEDEMNSGAVDVRTREEKRIGKMRVDDLVKMFNEQMPQKSKNFEDFYNKAWKPEDFPVQEAQPA